MEHNRIQFAERIYQLITEERKTKIISTEGVEAINNTNKGFSCKKIGGKRLHPNILDLNSLQKQQRTKMASMVNLLVRFLQVAY